MIPEISVYQASDTDLDKVLAAEKAAFGGDVEAELTLALLRDPSAEPQLSLLAEVNGKTAGHILFTRAYIPEKPALNVALLAPLAVVPEFQKQGVGTRLGKDGLRLLQEQGWDLVCVLGHIDYYPRLGFVPAHRLNIQAPYPIPEEVKDAWMAMALSAAGAQVRDVSVKCCEAMDRPEYWRE